MAINFIFFILLLIPIIRLKSDLLQFVTNSVPKLLRYGGVNLNHHRHHESDVSLMDLPIIRFEDLQNHRLRSIDRMCFICSEDYVNDDVLCQLSRCGDVFHSDCVGKLLHRKETDCPFCHAPVFAGLPPEPCA